MFGIPSSIGLTGVGPAPFVPVAHHCNCNAEALRGVMQYYQI